MVSSLPFLAPVCMKKAKEYRSKNSNPGYGGSSQGNSKNRGVKGEHFKLSDVSNDKSVFNSRDHNTGSEENILQNHAIMKSVTYSVRVDEEADGKPRRRNEGDNHV